VKVPPGQVGSPGPKFFNFVNCVERPVDQFHDLVLRAMRREAPKSSRQDRTRRRREAGKIRERERYRREEK